jgi:hypothetical protein
MEFNELKEYYANLIRESLLGEATMAKKERLLSSVAKDPKNPSKMNAYMGAIKRDRARAVRIGQQFPKGDMEGMLNNPERDAITRNFGFNTLLAPSVPPEQSLGNAIRSARSQYRTK